MFISLQGAEWYGTKLHTGLMCVGHHCFYSRCSSPLCGPMETSSCLAPDDVSTTEHSASLVLSRGTVCHPTFLLHQRCLLSKTGLRLIFFVFAFVFCSSVINLIRVAYVVRRPCSDFTDCHGALQIVVLLLLLLLSAKPMGHDSQ